MSRQKEGEFSLQLVKGIQEQRGWARKWPNLAKGETQPCDVIACVAGRFFAIESKYRELTSFSSALVVVSQADVRETQDTSLKEMRNSGIETYIAACAAIRGEKRAWMVPYVHFVAFPAWSIEMLEREKAVVELRWLPRVGWCLPSLPPPYPDGDPVGV